jgi:hypothetical protein
MGKQTQQPNTPGPKYIGIEVATVGGNLELQSHHLSDMIVGYDSGSGNSLVVSESGRYQ